MSHQPNSGSGGNVPPPTLHDQFQSSQAGSMTGNQHPSGIVHTYANMSPVAGFISFQHTGKQDDPLDSYLLTNIVGQHMVTGQGYGVGVYDHEVYSMHDDGINEPQPTLTNSHHHSSPENAYACVNTLINANEVHLGTMAMSTQQPGTVGFSQASHGLVSDNGIHPLATTNDNQVFGDDNDNGSAEDMETIAASVEHESGTNGLPNDPRELA
jgi:hypothetical protein